MTTPLSVPLLVESLADTAAEAFEGALSAALARADLVELRLDRLPTGTLTRVPFDVRDRVLVTCRAAWEGGGWTGPDDARHAVLAEALASGVRYVDVEWLAPCRQALLAEAPTRVVVSLHDFVRTPRDLAATVGAMAAARPAVVKVAVQAERLADVVRCRDAGRAAGDVPRVLIAMGARGVASRVLAGHIGSCWTYAGDGVAPGQVDARLMRKVFRVGRVTATAAVYGVAGRPIGHSLSPVLHNAAFEALGLDAVYVPFEAEDIDDLLETARALDVRGLSVTAPFKADALARCTDADAATRAIGACNTLTRTAEGWHGRNTDVDGFLTPLRARRPLAGARVAVVGGGGAARAVVTGLVASQATATVHTRRAEQAEAFRALGATPGPWPPPPGSWDVLVNTTPVGTAPRTDETPVPADVLGPGLVYDLVYNPATTRLLTEARTAGASTLGGLDMLVTQAACQCAAWFGVAPPVAAMRAAVARHAPHLLSPTEGACPE